MAKGQEFLNRAPLRHGNRGMVPRPLRDVMRKGTRRLNPCGFFPWERSVDVTSSAKDYALRAERSQDAKKPRICWRRRFWNWRPSIEATDAKK